MAHTSGVRVSGGNARLDAGTPAGEQVAGPVLPDRRHRSDRGHRKMGRSNDGAPNRLHFADLAEHTTHRAGFNRRTQAERQQQRDQEKSKTLHDSCPLKT